MSSKNGIVNLRDLPTRGTCIKLPSEIQKSMIENAISVSGNYYRLAKFLNVDRATIYDFEKSRFKSTTFYFVKLLSLFLETKFEEFSLKNLESKLELIKSNGTSNSIMNPKFPLNFNCKEGAGMIAGILFDGGITSCGYPFYTNNEETLINKFLKNVKAAVGKIEYNKKNNDRNIQIDLPKIFGLILINGLGMISGAKVFNDPKFPEFIIKNKNLYKTFLQQAFDDEGSLNTGRSGKCIQLSQYNSKNKPPIRLLQLKEMIQTFKIPVNGSFRAKETYNAKKGYTSYGFYIQISNQSDIKSFAEKINFSLERKREKLRLLLKSYKLPPRFKNNSIQDEILKVCQELKSKDEKITIKAIADKLNRSESWVAEVVRNMVNKEKLIVVEEKISMKEYRLGFSQKEFDVIE